MDIKTMLLSPRLNSNSKSNRVIQPTSPNEQNLSVIKQREKPNSQNEEYKTQ